MAKSRSHRGRRTQHVESEMLSRRCSTWYQRQFLSRYTPAENLQTGIMSQYSNRGLRSSPWMHSPGMKSEASFQTDSSPPSMQSSFISNSTTNSLSVLRDLDINARQELLDSPLVLVKIAWTDQEMQVPSALVSSYSPFIRARIADNYAAYNSQASSVSDSLTLVDDMPAVTIPFVQAAALEYLVEYMVNSASTLEDEPLQPPPSPRNTITCYHAIRVLQMPFCEKKFQATIMDFLSKETFSKEDIEAVWIFMNGIDPRVPGSDEKIVSHMVQNVAYRTEEGKLKFDGDVWAYVRGMPELERRVTEVGDRLRHERDGGRGKGSGQVQGLGLGSPGVSFGL